MQQPGKSEDCRILADVGGELLVHLNGVVATDQFLRRPAADAPRRATVALLAQDAAEQALMQWDQGITPRP